MNHRIESFGVPVGTMATLMLSVFVVSLGYGVVVPLLPYVIERLPGGTASAQGVSASTGLLTALYALSLFVFAPIWGRLSDRFGRRGILTIGLVGFSAATLVFSFMDSLVAVYVERLLSGMFAAAVTPVAMAGIGDLAASEEARGRGLTFVSLAGIGGFLLGPTLGVYLATNPGNLLPVGGTLGSLSLPLAWTAFFSFIAAGGVWVSVHGSPPESARPATSELTGTRSAVGLVLRLLILAFIVSSGVGAFEVGLALRGKQELGLSQYQIATMFFVCSLTMFVVQAVVFSPLIRPASTRRLIGPAFLALATGLALVPSATTFPLMLLVIGTVAASAGVLSPILTYWVSNKAGKAQGQELGLQTAASSLGAAIGSAAGGVLFDVVWLPNASFLLVAGLAMLGLLLSFGLSSMLVPPRGTEGATELT